MPDRVIAAKSGDDPRVYLQKNDKKYWVVNGAVLADLGFRWEEIKYVGDDVINDLPAGMPITSANQKIFEAAAFVYCVENTWSDDLAIGVSGWAVGKKQPISDLAIKIEDHSKKIQHWVSKPEIFDYFSDNTDYPVRKKCGFLVIIRRGVRREITMVANKNAGSAEALTYDLTRRAHIADFPVNKDLKQRFRDLVNKNHLSVLEIGSRISPGGVNQRDFFKGAQVYVGLDCMDGETVDVVGDAHELSKHFGRNKFSSLYSDSVLEHLAMPWKAVVEMNKVLKKGGYVFHSAPACWVPHDMPWDFWRFSDAGMRSLFSPPFGFRVIDVGYTSPVSIHNDEGGDQYANFPVSPAFGFVSVLAQKTHDINPRKIRFDIELKDVVGETSYPEWSAQSEHSD